MSPSLATILYPELRAVDAGDRRLLLARARRSPFDVAELLGMAAMLVGTALLADALADAWAAAAGAALVAPFFVRRTRRALRRLAEPR